MRADRAQDQLRGARRRPAHHSAADGGQRERARAVRLGLAEDGRRRRDELVAGLAGGGALAGTSGESSTPFHTLVPFGPNQRCWLYPYAPFGETAWITTPASSEPKEPAVATAPPGRHRVLAALDQGYVVARRVQRAAARRARQECRRLRRPENRQKFGLLLPQSAAFAEVASASQPRTAARSARGSRRSRMVLRRRGATDAWAATSTISQRTRSGVLHLAGAPRV